MIDWQQLTYVYGPLGIVIMFLLKAHRDIVYKTIPDALEALKYEARKTRRAYQQLATAFLESRCAQPARRRARPKQHVTKPSKTSGQTKKQTKKKRP